MDIGCVFSFRQLKSKREGGSKMEREKVESRMGEYIYNERRRLK